MKSLLRLTLLSVLPLLALALVGCGGSSKGKISGKLTYKGEPVKGGNIYLSSTNGGNYSSGILMDGSYSITDIPAGSYSVIVETDSVNPDRKKEAARTNPKARGGPGNAPSGLKEKMNNEYAAAMGKGAPPGEDTGGTTFGAAPKEELLKRYTKIPAKYGIKETSNLTAEVGNGNNTKDFELVD